MFDGKKRSFGQRLLNGSGGLTIEGPSGSRFDMRDEVDLLVLTRFGEMNFVAGPGERAFIAKMGLWVIRRIKAQSRWRQIFGFAPAQLTFHPVVLIHPGLPQGLNRRKLAQGRRSRWLVESVEQPRAICSDQLSIGFTRLAPSGQPRIFNAGTIAIKPLWYGVFTEPLWRTASKGIECRAHHLPNTFELIEGPVEELLGTGVYDFIISGLPLNNFAVSQVRTIFRTFNRLLKPGGTLSYYEYAFVRQLKTPFVGREERRRLLKVGRVVQRYIRNYQIGRKRILINVPPATVRRLRFKPALAASQTATPVPIPEPAP